MARIPFVLGYFPFLLQIPVKEKGTFFGTSFQLIFGQTLPWFCLLRASLRSNNATQKKATQNQATQKSKANKWDCLLTDVSAGWYSVYFGSLRKIPIRIPTKIPGTAQITYTDLQP